MRLRTTTTCALVCATAVAAFPLAAPATAVKPRQGVYVTQCDKVERSAAFLGRMRAIRGSDEMWMRFTLQERILPGRTFKPLSVPGLDVWHKSRPDVRRFGFRQRVRALAKAAIYKVGVAFRWYDADGRLMRESLERSRRCRQPGALPNLRVERIGRRANGQYFVSVINAGRDIASSPQVQLFVDGQDAGVIGLPDILPASVRATLFPGPDCDGFVQALVDPAGSVRESAEDDNALTVPCSDLE